MSSYTVPDYGAMIADRARIDAYHRALQQAVVPGGVVVDIGTGTGIFALLACRLGARRVYAIEPSDVIQVARECAAANGAADRIVFIQELSTDVALPERADVVVADLAGALPWHEQHIPSMADARRRFLAPGGVLIPQRDVAWAAVVEVEEFFARWTRPWDGLRVGLDLTPARRIVENSLTRIRVTADQLLTGVIRWASIDYTCVDDPNVRARPAWTVSRPGTAHGVVVGFERTVAEGVRFSNAPDVADESRATVYPPIFLPWPTAVAVDRGDEVEVDLEAHLVRGEYIWNWKSAVRCGGAGEPPVRFSQSTFFSTPLSPRVLRAPAGAGHRG